MVMLGSVMFGGLWLRSANRRLSSAPGRAVPSPPGMLVRRTEVSGNSLKIKLYSYARSVERDLPLATITTAMWGTRYPELQFATHVSNRSALESNKI